MVLVASSQQLAQDIAHYSITFNYPIVHTSLDIKGSNFEFVLHDDTMARPACAIMENGFEGNEQHAVRLIGHFGERDAGKGPKSVKIIGDLKLHKNDVTPNKEVSAKGLKMESSAGGNQWVEG